MKAFGIFGDIKVPPYEIKSIVILLIINKTGMTQLENSGKDGNMEISGQ